MANQTNNIVKKYTLIGIVAVCVVVIALLGVLAIKHFRKNISTESALKEVSEQSVKLADLTVAVINMDKIQAEAKVLKDLHEQRASYENKLKAKLEKEQKAIEKEKTDIEKSQDMLSQEALQRRVVDYQRRVNNFQRTLAEGAQSIESAYQDALNTIQTKHLDPIIKGAIAKKKLSLVIDGRMARIDENVKGLDITDEIVGALNKKVSTVKMAAPKGL